MAVVLGFPSNLLSLKDPQVVALGRRLSLDVQAYEGPKGFRSQGA